MHAPSNYRLLACTSNKILKSTEKIFNFSCVGNPIFAGEMLKFRRMSRSSNGRQKIRKRVVKKEVSSIVSDRRKAVVENITQELATKLSPSIVSLASFDGDYTIVCAVVSLVHT